MIKAEPKLKTLTANDKANIIETISDYIIGRDENGIVYYMPYMKDDAMVIAFTLYVIDGVKFESNDDIFDIYTKDKDINTLVTCFISNNTKLIAEIESYIDDVVEFKKSYIIHNNRILTNKLVEILDSQKVFEDYKYELAKTENRILNQQIEANNRQLEIMNHLTPEEVAELDKRMLSGEYDQQKIADAVVKSYINTVATDKENVVSMPKRKKTSTTSSTKTKKATKTAKVSTSESNK